MTTMDWRLQQMIKASGWPWAPDLLAPGSDFNAPVADGVSPLHWACTHGKDGLLKYMIGEGATLIDMAMDGQACLSMAVQSGSFQTVMLLIDWLKALNAPAPGPDTRQTLVKVFSTGHPNQKNRLQQTLKDWDRIQKRNSKA